MTTKRDRTLSGRQAAAAVARQKQITREAQIAARIADRDFKRRHREEPSLGRMVERLAKSDAQFRRMLLEGLSALAPANREASALNQPGGMIEALRAIPSPAEPVLPEIGSSEAIHSDAVPPTPPAAPPATSSKTPKRVPVQRLWWAQELTYDESDAAMQQRLKEIEVFKDLTSHGSKPSHKKEADKRMEGIAMRDGWRSRASVYRVRFFDTTRFPEGMTFPSALKLNLFLFNKYEPDVEIFCDDQSIDRQSVRAYSVLEGWSEQVDKAVVRLIDRGPPRSHR